jgi:hypothetical protein
MRGAAGKHAPGFVAAWAAWICAATWSVGPASAGDWIGVRETFVREELSRLVDAGRLQLPLGTWPMPATMIEAAMARAVAADPAAQDEFLALRAALATARHGGMSAFAAVAEPARLREQGAPWRDEAEVGVAWSRSGADPVAASRLAATLAVSVSRHEDGEQLVRFDGSHVTRQWGNWLLGAAVLDRHWGPGEDSSLILSDNARPMPALVLERATAQPFETRWLRWLGPWRASLFAARMEGERRDVDRPLFLGARVEASPQPWLTLGLSRTAQACGEGRACNLRTLRDLLLGNDNLGIDATSATEPGNQMAGIDLRIRSPWPSLPVAVRAQVIGEDESSYFPVKNLAQYGLVAWRELGEGRRLRGYLEYADTTCSYDRPQPRFDCAYRQGIFNVDGYRYRGRVIGHTSDNDAQTWTAALAIITPHGSHWKITGRDSRLNRGGAFDPTNTVTASPAEYASLMLAWSGHRGPNRLEVEIGWERFSPVTGGARERPVFGLRWEYRDLRRGR